MDGDSYQWQALERPFKKRGVQFYFNVAVICVALFLFLYLFHLTGLIFVMFATLFVGLAFTTVPPKKVTYTIATTGIEIADKNYPLEKVVNFWPTYVLNTDVFFVRTTIVFPRILVLVVSSEQKESVHFALKKYIEEIPAPEPTFVDTFADKLVKLVNLGQK